MYALTTCTRLLSVHIVIFFRADNEVPWGHLLGRALHNPQTPVGERNMSPIVTSVMRLLLHCGLYIAANRNPQVMSQPLIS